MASSTQVRLERFIKTGQQTLGNPSVIIWLIVVFLLVLARIISAAFLDVTHMLNIVRQASGLGIVTIGQTLVLITGGIDLSNGPVITLVDVLAATILNGKDDLLIYVVLLCLAIGLLVGLMNWTLDYQT